MIDWFTVLAQAFNFAILVLLLKRFLYGPILAAMEAREKRVAEALEQAEADQREARLRAGELAAQNRALAEAKSRLLAEAQEEVRQWRQDALTGVSHEVEALRQSWAFRLQQDRDTFLQRLREHIAGQVMAVSAKVLLDLADESLEKRLAAVLVDRLSRSGAVFADSRAWGIVKVQSGLPLPPDQSDLLRRQVMGLIPGVEAVSFEACPELGIGLRILAGDRKVEWNLAHYLKELERGVLAELPFPAGAEP